jgi:hypothetical protein
MYKTATASHGDSRMISLVGMYKTATASHGDSTMISLIIMYKTAEQFFGSSVCKNLFKLLLILGLQNHLSMCCFAQHSNKKMRAIATREPGNPEKA